MRTRAVGSRQSLSLFTECELGGRISEGSRFSSLADGEVVRGSPTTHRSFLSDRNERMIEYSFCPDRENSGKLNKTKI